jgi:hypothetical protein
MQCGEALRTKSGSVDAALKAALYPINQDRKVPVNSETAPKRSAY